MAKGDNLAKNASGYADPTACKAIRKVDRDRAAEEAEWWNSKNRLDDLLDCLKYIIEASDFELEGRIILKDKKTGRVWK